MRQHGERFLETHRAWMTGQHRRVLRAIAQCRTAALGGHRDRCDQCAQPALSYNSCRDRHCPKCLTAARNAWVAAREQELLPVGYVHIVFTMPEPLARVALANKRVVYDLLFQAAAETLLQVASESKAAWRRHWRADGAAHVGPAAAASSPRPLRRPMGGLAPDGARWIHARPRFFLPIAVLRKLFRGKLVAGLRDAFRAGRLDFPGAVGAAEAGCGLWRFRPIPVSPALGRVRQAALWQPRPRAPLPRALYAPRGHLEPPARQRHRRDRLVSLEGLPTRQSDADAHARRRRVSPPLLAPRLTEALRPDSLFRLPRVAVPHPRAPPVSPGACRRPNRHRSNRPSPHHHERRGHVPAAVPPCASSNG